MTRTILAFGDSNTWCLDPAARVRQPFEERWTTLVERMLPETRVIAEGLPGRTTELDDPSAVPDRNGLRVLPTLLGSHLPIDDVVVMLGTNDIKAYLGGTPASVVAGLGRIVAAVRSFPYTHGYGVPAITLVSPVHVNVTSSSRLYERFRSASVGMSREFAPLIATLAGESGCGFFDAAAVCEPSHHDGVHLDAGGSARLAAGLAAALR